MEEIVYGTSVTPQEYNQLRMAVGWYELTQRQAREGLAHTTFVACARVDGVCVAMGRILFDYGYTAYLGDVAVLPAWPADRGAAVPAGPGRRPAGGDHYVLPGGGQGEGALLRKAGL